MRSWSASARPAASRSSTTTSDSPSPRTACTSARRTLSCGTPAEARAVAPGVADYLGVGPIFATASKHDAGGPIGVNGVRVVVDATPLPVAAIGGIGLASLPRVRETGATMAAVISALAAAADPEAAARAFVAGWEGR